jgi:hypothetical protein
MKIKHVHNSFIAKMIGVDGITLYPFIFYKGVPSSTLVSHELVHVEQVKKYGWFGFYISYLLEYFSYRVRGYNKSTAYHKISYEIEAYKRQRA